MAENALNHVLVSCGESERRFSSSFSRALAFDRKFVIVLDHFTEKAGEKSERNALESGEIVEREFFRLRGIGVELFGFEIREAA